ncbi:MAG: type II secretion system F family protein [Dehalococcoidia bacterium]
MNVLVVSAGLLFGASVGLLVYYWALATAPRRLARARVFDTTEASGSSGLAPALRDVRGRIPIVDSLPLSAAARARMDVELDRAGVPLRVSEYLALRLGGTLAGGLVGLAVGAFAQLPLWLGALLALGLVVVGWVAPGWWVESQRRRRLLSIERQLPDALTLIAKSLRAGAGLMQAIGFAADETPDPFGAELIRALRDLRLGADPDAAFIQLAQRTGSQDIDIAVTAILIQRNVGGNLAEILNNVVRTIRERERLRAEVRVLTSRQRLSAWMMAAMPIAIGALFVWVNPVAGRTLIDTTPGLISLAIAVGFELLGLFLVNRLSHIEI